MSEATIPIQVEDLRAKASRELESVPDLDGLEAWRITYTGRRGQLTQLLRGLGALPSEERREAGAAANAVRAALEESLAEREDQL
ncbi:MAG TPA: phenylalanine--tRNA ligase subunit alpha, partial [Dehalococcoidia bacterium]|nr:phenylalanine--tRNA ligase subunit alpha [Dehalococcoidia bacterium]